MMAALVLLMAAGAASVVEVAVQAVQVVMGQAESA
jgi:hypothetical protein